MAVIIQCRILQYCLGTTPHRLLLIFGSGRRQVVVSTTVVAAAAVVDGSILLERKTGLVRGQAQCRHVSNVVLVGAIRIAVLVLLLLQLLPDVGIRGSRQGRSTGCHRLHPPLRQFRQGGMRNCSTSSGNSRSLVIALGS